MKKIISLFMSFLLVCFSTMAVVRAGSDTYVNDELGVLNSEDIAYYQQVAQALSDKYEFGVYVHLLYDDASYDDINAYIEQYYDTQALGYGSSHDGILFLITQSNQGGSFDILVPGNSTHQFFTIDGLEEIQSEVEDYLYDHDYDGAVNAYFREVTEKLNQYDELGTAWTYQNDPVRQKNRETGKWMITFGASPLLSLIIVMILKGKNKTKFIATKADSYHGRLQLRNSRDMFLYRTVSRTRIERNNHSSGGGFTSSSGGMHSGGGHF